MLSFIEGPWLDIHFWLLELISIVCIFNKSHLEGKDEDIRLSSKNYHIASDLVIKLNILVKQIRNIQSEAWITHDCSLFFLHLSPWGESLTWNFTCYTPLTRFMGRWHSKHKLLCDPCWLLGGTIVLRQAIIISLWRSINLSQFIIAQDKNNPFHWSDSFHLISFILFYFWLQIQNKFERNIDGENRQQTS